MPCCPISSSLGETTNFPNAINSSSGVTTIHSSIICNSGSIPSINLQKTLLPFLLNSAVSGFGNIKSATPQVGVKLPNTVIAKTVSNIIRLQWTNETSQAAGNYEIHRSLDSFKVTSFIVKTLANTTTSFLDSN